MIKDFQIFEASKKYRRKIKMMHNQELFKDVPYENGNVIKYKPRGKVKVGVIHFTFDGKINIHTLREYIKRSDEFDFLYSVSDFLKLKIIKSWEDMSEYRKYLNDKKEQMRVKMMDIDPYGEEDWDTNESIISNDDADIDAGYGKTKPKIIHKEDNSFIPFKLREKYVKGFKWNDKTVRIAYYDNDVSPNPRIIGSSDLWKELEKLVVGKRVEYHFFNYRTMTTGKIREVIKDFETNSRGILLFKTGNWETSKAVDERKPVTILGRSKNVNKELDPYEEEDWDD